MVPLAVLSTMVVERIQQKQCGLSEKCWMKRLGAIDVVRGLAEIHVVSEGGLSFSEARPSRSA